MSALPAHAYARTGDRDTSHRAALSVDNMNARHVAVLEVLRRMIASGDPNRVEAYADGMTHVDLIRWYNVASSKHPDKYPPQTEQSIRSRCAELVAAGIVVDTGIRVPLASGRRAAVWAPAPALAPDTA